MLIGDSTAINLYSTSNMCPNCESLQQKVQDLESALATTRHMLALRSLPNVDEPPQAASPTEEFNWHIGKAADLLFNRLEHFAKFKMTGNVDRFRLAKQCGEIAADGIKLEVLAERVKRAGYLG